jgi:hypothetical protein
VFGHAVSIALRYPVFILKKKNFESLLIGEARDLPGSDRAIQYDHGIAAKGAAIFGRRFNYFCIVCRQAIGANGLYAFRLTSIARNLEHG